MPCSLIIDYPLGRNSKEIVFHNIIMNIITGSLASLPGVNAVTITTNGLTLSHKLHQLYDNGLHGLNISLDTLIPQKFEFISRRNGWHKVMRSIDEALDMGISPLKVHL